MQSKEIEMGLKHPKNPDQIKNFYVDGRNRLVSDSFGKLQLGSSAENSSSGSATEPLMKLLSDHKYAMDQASIVAKTDEKGIISYVNDKFCDISGYQREELIGQSHSLLRSDKHDKVFFRQLWKVISSGEIWRGDICNKKKNGDLYWVATTIVPFLGETGKPYQYLAIRQDITELKLAQEKIVEQQSQLVMSSRLSAIGEMVAAVTHEINNPLGVILGRCEMMRDMIESNINNKDNLLRIINTISVTGHRIEKIVKSMRILSYQGDYEPLERVLINDLIENTLELCSQRFKNHGIQLIVPHLSDDYRVDCRPHHVLQALVNLLNNAHDAVLELVEKWVRIDILFDGKQIVISVTDSGKLIPSETQKKLFQPFFSTKKVQFGTGLGLSISKKLMQKQGGDLSFDESSANTRFMITLPLKPKPLIT